MIALQEKLQQAVLDAWIRACCDGLKEVQSFRDTTKLGAFNLAWAELGAASRRAAAAGVAMSDAEFQRRLGVYWEIGICNVRRVCDATYAYAETARRFGVAA